MDEVAMTKRSGCVFTVKEFASGRPFLSLELLGGELQLPGSISFGLKDGVPIEEAQEIAQYLNQHLQTVAMTSSH